jgi:uncharacterized protein GlcG (DUF336 family)
VTGKLSPRFSSGDRSSPTDRPTRRLARRVLAAACACALVAACSGGGSTGGDAGSAPASAGPANLAAGQVDAIIAQAANEAAARGVAATIAVVDRTGNVLAVKAVGTPPGPVVTSAVPTDPPADRRSIPSSIVTRPLTLESADLTALAGAGTGPALAAIAKAVTGAYLSSNGNAFTSRTASYIVQEDFPPSTKPSPFGGGPLFGVQFSQLPCSDLVNAQPGGATSAGPHRSPLGLSADPGGLPLYINGTLVGGIGVSSDGFYGLDRNTTNFDTGDVDELIALAGTTGFAAPDGIRADRIFVVGQQLRFIEARPEDLRRQPASAVDPAGLTRVAVPGYYNGGATLDGTTFGTVASGIAREGSAGEAVQLPEVEAFGLYRGGARVFTPTAAADLPAGTRLEAEDVRRLLTEALKIAFRGRAQIRQPLNSHIEVTVSVVDTNGTILGVARTPDAPVFGTDVSLQKARTATFFSHTPPTGETIGADLRGLYLTPAVAFLRTNGAAVPDFPSSSFAFAARSVGNLSRPFFPDGINNRSNGPLSLPFAPGQQNAFQPPVTTLWSPFGTGLQLDLILPDIAAAFDGTVAAGTPAAPFCGVRGGITNPATPGTSRVANGFQIFSGGVPLFRNGTLVGGIGVSGDGINQDDMVAFLGANNGGSIRGNGLGNAPPAVRADQISIKPAPSDQPGNLLYVQCPPQPFLDSDATDPCSGL